MLFRCLTIKVLESGRLHLLFPPRILAGVESVELVLKLADPPPQLCWVQCLELLGERDLGRLRDVLGGEHASIGRLWPVVAFGDSRAVTGL